MTRLATRHPVIIRPRNIFLAETKCEANELFFISPESDHSIDWPRHWLMSLAMLSLVLRKVLMITRQSKHCGFSIYIFDNSKSKSMVRLVRSENMVLSGLVFARKIARMISIQNI